MVASQSTGQPFQGQALVVADRHQRGAGIQREQPLDQRDVQPAVHGDHGRRVGQLGERERPHVGVGVDDVELVAAAVDVGQHPQVQVRAHLGHLLGVHPLAQRRLDEGLQPGRRVRATGGEQCDVVARCDEAVAEPGDHPLGAAVASRRDVLVQRGDLGDAHQPTSIGEAT